MGNNLDTLFLDRFVDALSRMCRATPPRDACAAWIDTDSDELQCWVGLHADLPDWSQCIVLIDAAIVWASTPVEGRAYGQHGNYVHATIESLRAQLAEVTDELEIMRHQRDQAQDERDEARAKVARLAKERDARPDIATLPTEHACGEWIMSGQAEPDAVVTYASEPSPETGHEGWCWWARGKMGEAKDYMAAREAAERSLRAHAKSGGSDA